MTELERFARNQRFSGIRSCILTDCGEGNVALFSWGGSGELLYLGDDMEELTRVFRARPEWTYKPKEPTVKLPKGITLDLSSLGIDL